MALNTRHWTDQLLYALNFLTALLFLFLVVYPVYSYIQMELEGVPRKSLGWHDCVAILILYGYAIFCLKRLVRYLRHPDPDHNFFFLLYLLGMVPLSFVLFMLAMVGFSFVGGQ